MSGAWAEGASEYATTGPHNVADWCYLHRVAKAFVDFVDINPAYFDIEHDRCYCGPCYPPHYPSVFKSDGPTHYLPPKGWFRFGLRAPARMEALNAFEDWSVSYHGVSSSVVLKSILDCGQLMKAGDTLLDGTKL